uniref:Uncharacterized protein n=1 Tax=Arundo donax TaxID=35708 RepID=A0A0A8Z1L9_ARUDO
MVKKCIWIRPRFCASLVYAHMVHSDHYSEIVQMNFELGKLNIKFSFLFSRYMI